MTPTARWSQLYTHTYTHTHINHIMCHFSKHTNRDRSFVRFLICRPNIDFCAALANSLCLCLSLLSGVKAQRGGRLTPWTHLWTQPGITLGTQTLITQTGMNSLLLSTLLLFIYLFNDSAKPPNSSLFIHFSFFFLHCGTNCTDFIFTLCLI